MTVAPTSAQLPRLPLALRRPSCPLRELRRPAKFMQNSPSSASPKNSAPVISSATISERQNNNPTSPISFLTFRSPIAFSVGWHQFTDLGLPAGRISRRLGDEAGLQATLGSNRSEATASGGLTFSRWKSEPGGRLPPPWNGRRAPPGPVFYRRVCLSRYPGLPDGLVGSHPFGGCLIHRQPFIHLAPT